MNWNHWIRQTHRWLSIVFTLTVIASSPWHSQRVGCLRPG